VEAIDDRVLVRGVPTSHAGRIPQRGIRPYLPRPLDRCWCEKRTEKGVQMLGLLIVIALILLLFGVVGGIAISKFLFFLLLVAGVVFLIGLFTRAA
jgi:hypothetical protein